VNQQGVLTMSQRDRDRLVVLRKLKAKQIKQAQAATELGVSVRHVRRLLERFQEGGDKAMVHGLRGRASNRKRDAKECERAVRVLSQEVYRGFGPTLAAEYLAKHHKLRIGREALRQLMMAAGLWRSRRQKVDAVHDWRPRRSRFGELVQWDTSNHDWLEGRGKRLYLIHMIDDATSELVARFVDSDSTAENMQVLRQYLERNGRPLAFYTDKASLFQTAVKRRRDTPGEEIDPVEMEPTQIGRALRELGIAWIAAHSPQAKGRVERSFRTAQDRLVKGMRVAGVETLAQANQYLEKEFLPWWNQHLKVLPGNSTDAHRPLGPEHDLSAILSIVETRLVANDYTIQFQAKTYQIAREDVRAGLRGATVRIETRLNGTMAVRSGQRYLTVSECHRAEKVSKPKLAAPRRAGRAVKPTAYARRTNDALFHGQPIRTWQAAQIDRTRTSDRFD
jgi:transposase